jgi:RHS repeat-associated protein
MVNNLFQGMALDPATGLYYERARWYSPSLGVWASQDPAGYINGADTYQFVMGNPVDRADPTGLSVPCYKCLQILDQEKAQALHQIEQEAIGLGIPSLSAWKIVGTSVVLAGTLGTFGGPITGAVVLAIGLAEGGKKFIELHAMQEQIDAEISSDVAAFHNCMRNCCS